MDEKRLYVDLHVVQTVPATNPRFSRKRFVSSFPPTLRMVFVSPIEAIVKGIFFTPFFKLVVPISG